MRLVPGTRFGHYEILSPLGAGGMGEVFRAKDTRLDRDVAIKVLPEAFVADPERVARFEREARTLAALNHPHIAAIYGLEESHGVSALVMELVGGATLAERIAQGALPLDEALPIARQIAEALEAAHGQGIIHRDLKPANIKVRPDGSVKVLDFGLAKALESGATAATGTLANSPTIASPAVTMRGVILGTAAYMSPEQARGKALDARADIWAFGCVLYEMLAGRAAFAGETVTDILAAVVQKEPDWTLLPETTPPGVRDVLARCLRKDPSRRTHHMADVRIALDDAQMVGPADMAAGPARAGGSRWMPAVALAAATAAAGALAVWVGLSPGDTPSAAYSFTIPEAGFNTVSTTAISHDGRWVAYSPNAAAAPFKLLVRPFDSFEARELVSTTETGFNPFFSADDRWIAYFNREVIYRVAVSGGAPERIGTFTGFPQGAWGPDNAIVIASNLRFDNVQRRALATLPTGGGPLVPLTTPSPGESHLDPEILPDGRTVLFTIATPQGPSIAAVPLSGGQPRIVLNDARTPKYAATGHLVFQKASSGDLMAMPFDAGQLEPSGEASRLGSVALLIDTAAMAIARNGTLIYSAPGDTAEQSGFTIVSVDRSGAESTILDQSGGWATPRVSPDGRTVLYRSIQSPNCELWAIDLARGTRTRVTFEGDNHDPVWRHDGRATWGSQTTGPRAIRMAPVDRPTQVTTIAESPNERRPTSWSRDGSRLAFTETRPDTGSDLWVLSTDSGEARPLVATKFNEDGAVFSPDGRWVAYVSDESGRNEVYLGRADGESGRLQLSANGGLGPLWSPDGKELYFAEGSQLMAVTIDLGAPSPLATRPRVLLRGPYVWERPANYDIMPDGRRFVFVRRAEGADPSATLRVILNWPARLP